jgi:hypothetical protein
MGVTVANSCQELLHLRYNTFGTMRRLLCEAAGYGSLDQYVGYGGKRPWSAAQKRDVLVYGLLRRFDVEDTIPKTQCRKLAQRIRRLVPFLNAPTPRKGQTDLLKVIKAFVGALERCADAKMPLGWS